MESADLEADSFDVEVVEHVEDHDHESILINGQESAIAWSGNIARSAFMKILLVVHYVGGVSTLQ